LQWFRGPEYDVEDELTKLKDTIQEAEQNNGPLGDLMSSRGTVKALIIALGLMKFQQLSGINVVIFYSGKIFESSSSSLSANTDSIIIGVVQVSRPGVASLMHIYSEDKKNSLCRDLGFSQRW
jgi:SP family facilitated glucose transporter-like MFS transporter 8